MEIRGKRVAESADPRRDLKNTENEYSQWMNSVHDLWMEYDHEYEALKRHYGGDFTGFDEALLDLSRRPKYKSFVGILGEYQSRIKELMRLCRLTEPEPDSSESWAWMVKEKIAPKNGKPGHPYHQPTKHVHFQEGPRRKRSSII